MLFDRIGGGHLASIEARDFFMYQFGNLNVTFAETNLLVPSTRMGTAWCGL
jgi:hypothetical protein